MSITLRTAGPDDADAIHRLVVALAVYEREPDAVRSTPAILRGQLAAARPPFECLLADEDGVACGFALFFSTYSTWVGKPGLWLEDLFVEESHRRRGVGRMLLRAVAGLAIERDCGRLEWSVLDWNTSAIAFYRSIGAVGMDAWKLQRVTGPALTALARS